MAESASEGHAALASYSDHDHRLPPVTTDGRARVAPLRFGNQPPVEFIRNAPFGRRRINDLQEVLPGERPTETQTAPEQTPVGGRRPPGHAEPADRSLAVARRRHSESAEVKRFAGVLYPECFAPVEFVGRSGGGAPSVGEILQAAESLARSA